MAMEIHPPKKIPTGIEGFEHLTLGGLPEGRTTLAVGTSGSGKTMRAVEFLYRSLTEFDRPGVFVTLEERPVEIMRNVKRLGWDIAPLVEQERLAFVDGSPSPTPATEVGPYDLEGLVIQIKHQVRSLNAQVVVIDSIGSLFQQFKDTEKIRLEIFRIAEVTRDLGVTCLMTAERLDEYGRISRSGVEEFVSDNVIVLRNVLADEKCRRTIQVLKMRGSQHDKQIREFTIDNHGMHIGEPFINVQNIILGNPSSQGVRDTEHLGRMFD